jgi:hypothetical protein
MISLGDSGGCDDDPEPLLGSGSEFGILVNNFDIVFVHSCLVTGFYGLDLYFMIYDMTHDF